MNQDPRACHEIMDAYLLRSGLMKSFVDPNLYIKVVNNKIVIILLYVGMLLITSVERRIQDCKKMLVDEF